MSDAAKLSAEELDECMHEMLGAADLLTSDCLDAVNKDEWARALRASHDQIRAHIAALTAEVNRLNADAQEERAQLERLRWAAKPFDQLRAINTLSTEAHAWRDSAPMETGNV